MTRFKIANTLDGHNLATVGIVMAREDHLQRNAYHLNRFLTMISTTSESLVYLRSCFLVIFVHIRLSLRVLSNIIQLHVRFASPRGVEGWGDRLWGCGTALSRGTQQSKGHVTWRVMFGVELMLTDVLPEKWDISIYVEYLHVYIPYVLCSWMIMLIMLYCFYMFLYIYACVCKNTYTHTHGIQ